MSALEDAATLILEAHAAEVAQRNSPVRPIRTLITNDDPVGYTNRILIGTATRGWVNIHWHNAVCSLTVPPNWSMVRMTHQMSAMIPVRFQVADAQNLIVRECLQKDFEFLLLLEDDTIPPVDLYVRLNRYMRDGTVPIVSGLYFTKAEPSEPLIFRGRGNGTFLDFKLGDRVWCDGVPTGCLLIHRAILQAMWDESEEYTYGGQSTRRVFETPVKHWADPKAGEVNTAVGTSDLEWCKRIITGGYFKKAGWTDFEGKEFPFLVDTNILCGHIDENGQVFPTGDPFPAVETAGAPDLGIAVSDGTFVQDIPGGA